MSEQDKAIIGITRGDQAGIGPEVVAAALASGELSSACSYQVIGEQVDAVLGKPDATTARAALDGLEQAAQMLKGGQIDAVVTAPVGKEGLHELGFDFPGQTEFFAERLGCDNHAMCLTGKNLTVALVTIHVALADVPGLLRQEEIVRVGLLLADFCRQRGIQSPRIAVCGLNPHAGEGGHLGSEEIKIINPVIEQFHQQGIAISGPYPADTLFTEKYLSNADAVLAMYHDQGLPVLKHSGFGRAANITLGLPIIRTSVDHGTALDLAGKGIADKGSFEVAVNCAAQMAERRTDGSR